MFANSCVALFVKFVDIVETSDEFVRQPRGGFGCLVNVLIGVWSSFIISTTPSTDWRARRASAMAVLVMLAGILFLLQRN